MLTYRELAVMGYCPSKNYGYMKSMPVDFKMPPTVTHEVFKLMPLQIQVMYGLDIVDGKHSLTRHFGVAQ